MSLFLAHGCFASDKIYKTQCTAVWTCLNLPVKNSYFFAFIFSSEKLISVISLRISYLSHGKKVPVSPSWVAGEKEALACSASMSLAQWWLWLIPCLHLSLLKQLTGAISATLTGWCALGKDFCLTTVPLSLFWGNTQRWAEVTRLWQDSTGTCWWERAYPNAPCWRTLVWQLSKEKVKGDGWSQWLREDEEIQHPWSRSEDGAWGTTAGYAHTCLGRRAAGTNPVRSSGWYLVFRLSLWFGSFNAFWFDTRNP